MTNKAFAQITDDLVLTGTMVELRRHRPTDYPLLREILNDQETMKALQPYFGITHWSVAKVRERYEKFDSDPRALSFTVLERPTGKIVGNSGFKNLDSDTGRGEFGLILHKSVWGKGISNECHLLGLDFGFHVLGLKQIYFTTDEWNHRMRRFFEKYRIPQIETTEEDCLYFELSHQEWPATRELLRTNLKP